MADEPGRLSTYDDEFKRSQDERFAQLIAALQRGPMPPAQDSATPRGIDAYVIQQIVSSMVGEKTSVFLTRDQIRDLVREVVSGEEGTKRTLRLIDERLGNIGLRMDDEHIEDTGNALRGAVRWHRLASRMFMTALSTIGLGLVYELLKKVGFNIPTGG